MADTLLYSFHPVADEQQTNIWIYTYQHWGEQQADKYIDELHEKLSQVALNFSLVKDLPDSINKEIKYIHYGRHYIFLKKAAANLSEKLQVLAILHDSMDIPFHLHKILDQF